jgi:hypothetical protein
VALETHRTKEEATPKGKKRKATCLDVDVVGEEHGHAVDTHAPTGGGRETILERGAEHVVDELSLIITLRIESKVLTGQTNVSKKKTALSQPRALRTISLSLAWASKQAFCLAGSFNSV